MIGVATVSKVSPATGSACDARQDGVRKAGGTRPVRSLGIVEALRGRRAGAQDYGLLRQRPLGVLPLSRRQVALTPADSRVYHGLLHEGNLLRQILSEATSKKARANSTREKQGQADVAGRRTLRMRAPTHTQNRACAVGPVADRGARCESVWRPSAKLSCPRTCTAHEGAGTRGRRVGRWGYPVFPTWLEADGRLGH